MIEITIPLTVKFDLSALRSGVDDIDISLLCEENKVLDQIMVGFKGQLREHYQELLAKLLMYQAMRSHLATMFERGRAVRSACYDSALGQNLIL